MWIEGNQIFDAREGALVSIRQNETIKNTTLKCSIELQSHLRFPETGSIELLHR